MSAEVFYIVLQLWAFFIALCVGSYMNVAIARMPEDRSTISPPSHCPACGTDIQWYDNIPVISWALLRAKCRSCGTHISALYPAIELLVGVLGLLLFRKLIPDLHAVTGANLAGFGVYLTFVGMMVGTTYVDLRHYIIPDQFSIYAVPVGVIACAALGFLGFEGAPSWQQSVVGALFGGGVLLPLLLGHYLLTGREGMGMGDIKLLAMIGAFMGAWPPIFVVLLLAAVFGSAVGILAMVVQRKGVRTMLPFGPFLAAAAVIYLYFGPELVSRFLPGLPLVPEVSLDMAQYFWERWTGGG